MVGFICYAKQLKKYIFGSSTTKNRSIVVETLGPFKLQWCVNFQFCDLTFAFKDYIW